MTQACEVCAIDPTTRGWATGLRKPNVASFPSGFDYHGQRCYTACFFHRSVLDRPPPDDWKPRRNAVGGPSDSFMMDLENEILRDFGAGYVPKGKKRHADPQWAALVRRNVDPHHTDVTWCEYVSWVSRGGGDEWFLKDEPEPPLEPGPVLQMAALSTVFEQLQGPEIRNLKRKLEETTLELERTRAELVEHERAVQTLINEERDLRRLIRGASGRSV
jgi:hypothetical protein